MLSKQPKLTLVGAGPGDPELITLKAIRAIESADVILYDALVNKVLLEYSAEKALKIFVGKRAGLHSLIQTEINELIVEYALKNNHVVRLKGGDPMIFGRGQEEIEHAQSYGIETAIVPGISSAIAVPTLQHIPLTARGVSESFWVITATKANHEISKDIEIASQSSATVVILMGTQKIKEIVKIYQQQGKGNIGVAIIQNGTSENEKYVLGTIDTITEKAEDAQIGSPAVIVVGEVVKLHPKMLHASNLYQTQWV
jgi:uroporphyrin-III C-methyltransferase